MPRSTRLLAVLGLVGGLLTGVAPAAHAAGTTTSSSTSSTTVAPSRAAAAAPAARSVSLTPATGIQGGDMVQVTATGFTPGATLGGGQCIVDSTPDTGDCSGVGLVGSADGTGKLVTSRRVDRWIYVPSAGAWVDCAAPSAGCVIAIADIGNVTGTFATAPLVFGTPPPPPVTRGTITLTPSTVPKLPVFYTVNGTGFRPNAEIELFECGAGASQRADCVTGVVTARTDGSGAFTRQYYGGATISLAGRPPVNCAAASGACVIAAAEAVDFVGTLATQPVMIQVVVVPGAVSAPEGDAGTATVDVPVHLSTASGVPVTVQWSTVFSADWDPTAAAEPGVDYTTASGTVTFAPGVTQQTVPVPVLGDTTPERDETVVVGFHDATNATVGGFYGLGFATITDDDTPTIVPGAASVNEGDTGTTVVLVPVHLSKASSQPVSVDWATVFSSGWDPAVAAQPGVDYDAASGNLVFPPGTTDLTVPVTVRGDTVVESGELIVLQFSNATGGKIGGLLGLGLGGIVDDDAVAT